ncbi:hypothetical protein CHUAL_007878 [Chamberlinius hualienensis]
MSSSALKEDIVISGISGKFPDADNVQEYRNNLMNGIDMVTDDDRRWPSGLMGIPRRHGKLKDLTKFDADAFGINPKHAEEMDPQSRIFLETAYEAIADAGINPLELRGKKVGVFLGISTTEAFEGLEKNPEAADPYCLIGCTRSMFANRISFHFDFHGPSFVIDTACSSSLTAVNEALLNIQMGFCEAAIVGGVNINLKPTIALGFAHLGVLSEDGRCKSFDADANGFARSEAVVSVFLQKRCQARREYATIINYKVNTDGYKIQGVTYPNGERQSELLAEVYSEAGIDTKDVCYIECHGTGTPVGDPVEVNSIANTLCQDRNGPLLVGSVKSNMGHSEGASGLTSLLKVIIAMEEGVIPANLHYKTPNPNIPALVDGGLKVVDKNTAWNGGIVGINNFGWGGANAHLVIRSNPNPIQTSQALTSSANRLKLFTHAGRTMEGVKRVLDAMEKDPDECNLYTLLSYLANSSSKTHPFRGYTILNATETTNQVEQSPLEKRPLWFVFTGIGCQWSGMAKDMMQVPIFRETFLRADKTLQPYNVNLSELIAKHDDEFWINNTEAKSVAIIVCQIAFVNIFRQFSLEADGIIGHSIGEVSCAYADGCITEEQCVLLAYWRTKLIMENSDLNCLMYSVGMSVEEIESRLPEGVYCACHNAKDNVTISGKKQVIETFVSELVKEGIFTKLVPTSGRGFHCPIMNTAIPVLSQFTDKLLQNPKCRSSRWISTAFPEFDWNSNKVQYFSTEYNSSNIVNPVYFYEGLQKIPNDAVIVEIGPHALFQGLIKRSVGPQATILGLQNRDQTDGYLYFLTSLGKMYINGIDFDLNKLYEPVKLPVPRGTKMISPLIKWDHSKSYHVVPYDFFLKSGKSHEIEVSIVEEKSIYYYLKDYKIDGRILYPGTGYLELAWKLLAQSKGKVHSEMSVVFEDVVFKRATILSTTETTKFVCGLMNGEGRFEISESGSTVATGRIYELENSRDKSQKINLSNNSHHKLKMTSKDIYKEFRLKGYQFGPAFQTVSEMNVEGNSGKIKWSNNWVTFIDGIIQTGIIAKSSGSLYLPSRIDYIEINTKLHPTFECSASKYLEIPVTLCPIVNAIQSGGITINGFTLTAFNTRPIQQASPVLEHYSFVANHEIRNEDLNNVDVLKSCLDIIRENSTSNKFQIIEINATEGNLFESVLSIFNSMLLTQVECTVTDINTNKIQSEEVNGNNVKLANWNFIKEEVPPNLSGAHLVFGFNVLHGDNNQLMKITVNLTSAVREGGFLLLSQSNEYPEFYKAFESAGLRIICQKTSNNNSSLFLLRKVEKTNFKLSVIVVNDGEYDKWVEPIKTRVIDLGQNENTDDRLWLIAHDKQTNGILGLVNCLRLEPGGNNIRTIFNPHLDQSKANSFLLDPVNALKTIYQDIIDKDLFINVNSNGQWGTYRHLPLRNNDSRNEIETTTAYVNVLNRGDLSSLHWIESPIKKLIGNNKHICRIYFAALNFKDVMLASGKISPDAPPEEWAYKDCLGMEFSGRDENGNRMMGIVPYRGLATSSTYDPNFKWEIPEKWTLEDAATVPLVYSTAYYALVIRGNIKRNETILIHSGSGGVGQAAINVALSYGCEIFTTVGSENKKDFLLKLYPQLKPNNIFNSRDTTFEHDVLLATNGKGVDMVLNSLAEEKLLASVRCLGRNGRFLEIGKFDLSNNASLGMGVFLKNISFHGVFLDNIIEYEHPDKQLVRQLLKEGITSGTVKPLTRHVFSKNEVEDAFRFMASGKHIGKVLIKIVEEELKMTLSDASLSSIKAIPKAYCSSQKSYIIAGGIGEFGLELAFWLIDRGAKNLILSSRSGIKDGYQARCIRVMCNREAQILVSTDDITTIKGTTALIEMASKLAPVGGIFNLAMVLKDALMENQTVENYIDVTNPKAIGTSNLDKVSRQLCSQLEWFVAFSSISCGRGNAGQSNYGYANSVMERICEQRNYDGLHGLAIQWGAIGDVGIVFEKLGGNDVNIAGSSCQTIHSCTNALDTFLIQKRSVVSSYVCFVKICSMPDKETDLRLYDRIGHVMGVKDFTKINPKLTLTELGMDSIMAVEVKQILEKHFDYVVEIRKLRNLEVSAIIAMDSNNLQT